MATGPDTYRWSLEVVSMKVSGRLLRPLDSYHPIVLDALLHHFPARLKVEGLRRAREEEDAEDAGSDVFAETGDAEMDEMLRAMQLGVDPTTLPGWDGDDDG